MADETPSAPEAQVDYDSMDLDQLEREFDEHKGEIHEQLVAQTSDPMDDEPVAEKAEPEVPVEEAEEPTPDESVEVDPAEAQDDPVDAMHLLEVAQAKVEKVEAERDRDRFLADRNAGMVGHLQQQMNALREHMAAKVDATRDNYEDEPVSEPSPRRPAAQSLDPELQSELDEIRSDRVRRTLEEESQSFQAEVKPFFDQVSERYGQEESAQVAEDIKARVAAMPEEYKQVLTGTDAKLAAVTARSIFRSAMADAKLAFLERRPKKATQLPESRRRKMEAASAADSSSDSLKKGSEPKSIDDMSLEEIDAALTEMNPRHGGFRG